MVILQEALILSVLGFIPGFLLATGLYRIVHAATALPIAMSLSRTVLVFPLTALMCSLAGALAMRRLRDADPADVF